MWKVREIADKVTNVVMNYTEIEAKVREATNDEAWGPTGALMQEIAHATFAYEHYAEVMGMLYRRLVATGDNRKCWRRVYKSLLLLHYLVRNGSERVVTSAREHLYDLRALESYTCVDEFNKDQGINIRHKAKDLIEFIQDDDRLREERKKAKKNKDKYIGMSSDGTSMSGFGPGSGDQWEDLPPAKDWSKEDDWDTERVAGFEESENTSDNEVDDSSDVDSSPPPPTHTANLPSSTLPPTPITSSVKPPPPSAKSSPSKKSTGHPLKKIDLGAAAHYGKTSSSQPTSNNQHSTGKVGPPPGGDSSAARSFDLLGELITPDATPPGKQSTNNGVGAADFGDFEAADVFSSNVQNSLVSSSQQPVSKVSEGGDDFADFSSAFSSSNSNSNHSSNSTPLAQPALAQQSNADLLSGLSPVATGFNTLSMSMQTQSASLIPGFNDGAILQPINHQAASNINNNLAFPGINFNNNHKSALDQANANQLGSTWTNAGSLNINLDNLTLSNPNAIAPSSGAPSMNQLQASKPQPLSPTPALFRPPQTPAPAGLFGPTPTAPTMAGPAGGFGSPVPNFAAFPPTPQASPNYFAAASPSGPGSNMTAAPAPFYNQFQNFQTSLK
uniref:Clathrin interactor 1 n=1 Tax=Cacopsylla melanoneura TaxID=428564 RepID=A0A8D8M0F2_9HEMI